MTPTYIEHDEIVQEPNWRHNGGDVYAVGCAGNIHDGMLYGQLVWFTGPLDDTFPQLGDPNWPDLRGIRLGKSCSCIVYSGPGYSGQAKRLTASDAAITQFTDSDIGFRVRSANSFTYMEEDPGTTLLLSHDIQDVISYDHKCHSVGAGPGHTYAGAYMGDGILRYHFAGFHGDFWDPNIYRELLGHRGESISWWQMTPNGKDMNLGTESLYGGRIYNLSGGDPNNPQLIKMWPAQNMWVFGGTGCLATMRNTGVSTCVLASNLTSAGAGGYVAQWGGGGFNYASPECRIGGTNRLLWDAYWHGDGYWVAAGSLGGKEYNKPGAGRLFTSIRNEPWSEVDLGTKAFNRLVPMPSYDPGYLYACSVEGQIYRSNDPISGNWEFVWEADADCNAWLCDLYGHAVLVLSDGRYYLDWKYVDRVGLDYDFVVAVPNADSSTLVGTASYDDERPGRPMCTGVRINVTKVG